MRALLSSARVGPRALRPAGIIANGFIQVYEEERANHARILATARRTLLRAQLFDGWSHFKKQSSEAILAHNRALSNTRRGTRLDVKQSAARALLGVCKSDVAVAMSEVLHAFAEMTAGHGALGHAMSVTDNARGARPHGQLHRIVGVPES